MRTDEAKALAMIVFDVVVVILVTLSWLISIAWRIGREWREQRRQLKEIEDDVERLSGRLVSVQELPPVKDGRYR